MGRQRVFWGIVLTAAGVALLLQRVGWWPGTALRQVVAPLVLIALGAYVLWAAATRREPPTEQVSIPSEGLERARIAIKQPAGRLRVNAGAAPGTLVSGTFAGGVAQRVTREGSSADVQLGVSPGGGAWTRWAGGVTWDIALNPEIAIDLRVDSGAGEAVIDLTELKVTDLRMETGVGAARVHLPARAGRTRARVNTGVGEVTIRVPDGVAARIRAASSLGDVSVNRERFPGSGGAFESPDYATATDAVELDLHSGVGAVRVE